jgi:hypothetical protein
MIRTRLEVLRQAQGLVEVVLYDAPHEILSRIEASGGQIGEYHYDTWCHSNGTCAHNSHDPGQGSTHVYIPSSWLEEAKGASPVEWDLTDADTAAFLLPEHPPLLAVTHEEGHWARRTYLRQLRPEAAAVLASESLQGEKGESGCSTNGAGGGSPK